ncbi:Catalase [Acetobacter malorum]|uniref:Catalase n=1 Tax=Acetobacter malorum TaxID=178901 RepID=A0A177G797_9PROT|nr:catalase [Acetobacter malorum]OAG76172.1 Catalase [Acetobacter malorum]
MAAKSTGPSRSALRWLGVAAAPAALALGFFWAGGWLSPNRVTQNRLMAELHDAGSYGHGFRRAHAKGVCVTGRFDASGAAASVSKAAIFREHSVPVVGRFALGAGQPYVADNPATVRSMALRFMPKRCAGMACRHEQSARASVAGRAGCFRLLFFPTS